MWRFWLQGWQNNPAVFELQCYRQLKLMQVLNSNMCWKLNTLISIFSLSRWEVDLIDSWSKIPLQDPKAEARLWKRTNPLPGPPHFIGWELTLLLLLGFSPPFPRFPFPKVTYLLQFLPFRFYAHCSASFKQINVFFWPHLEMILSTSVLKKRFCVPIFVWGHHVSEMIGKIVNLYQFLTCFVVRKYQKVWAVQFWVGAITNIAMCIKLDQGQHKTHPKFLHRV